MRTPPLHWIILALISLFYSLNAFGNLPVWSKTGHRIVGEIASNYLNRKARRTIEDLLEGRSIAYVSNFADEIKSDPRYDKYYPWHYVNYPLDKDYSEITPDPSGDVVAGIATCIRILEDDQRSRADRIFFLKMLIHLVGDIHQPLHAGRKEDKGGNTIQVRWFGRGSNLHRVWDRELIDNNEMSYTELAASLSKIGRRERMEQQAGDVYDWVEESHAIAGEIYSSVSAGEKLGYSYSYQYWATVERQLRKGGLRLAKVLNEIFS